MVKVRKKKNQEDRGSLSDGAGTKSISNQGVPHTLSQPNSDDETAEKVEKAKKAVQNLTKRLTRSSKDQDDLSLALV